MTTSAGSVSSTVTQIFTGGGTVTEIVTAEAAAIKSATGSNPDPTGAAIAALDAVQSFTALMTQAAKDGSFNGRGHINHCFSC